MYDRSDEETLSGRIDKIIFDSGDFRVIEVNGHRVVGNLKDLLVGNTITCNGRWYIHRKYGRHFSANSFTIDNPKTTKGIVAYLSGSIPGIGKVVARRIATAFGTNSLEIVRNNPYKLKSIKGIGRHLLSKFIDHSKEHDATSEVRIFLKSNNCGDALVKKIYQHYGDRAIDLIQKNPYIISKDIPGIGFKRADQLAIELGYNKESPKRIISGIEHTLQMLESMGHTCYEEDKLVEAVELLLSIDKKLIEKELYAVNTIHKESVGKTTLVWSKKLYLVEQSVAKELSRIIKGERLNLPSDLDQISSIEKSYKINLSDQQRAAIDQATRSKILIITGGPGSGKTTITKIIIEIYQCFKCILCAPTGKAAKRLSQITGQPTNTIHTLLEYDFRHRSFKKSHRNPINADIIIIDEASMIDIYLSNHLLKAIPTHCRVIFIGDFDQLPSIGPGKFLHDLILSKKIAMVSLSKIFRQSSNSDIIINAHRIKCGIGQLSYKEGDFILIDEDDPKKISEQVITLYKEQSKKYDPLEDIQVLSPTKKRYSGI